MIEKLIRLLEKIRRTVEIKITTIATWLVHVFNLLVIYQQQIKSFKITYNCNKYDTKHFQWRNSQNQ